MEPGQKIPPRAPDSSHHMVTWGQWSCAWAEGRDTETRSAGKQAQEELRYRGKPRSRIVKVDPRCTGQTAKAGLQACASLSLLQLAQRRLLPLGSDLHRVVRIHPHILVAPWSREQLRNEPSLEAATLTASQRGEALPLFREWLWKVHCSHRANGGKQVDEPSPGEMPTVVVHPTLWVYSSAAAP